VSALYVYALLDGPVPAPAARGVTGEAVRVVAQGDVAAAVGDVAGAPEPSRATLEAHDALVRELAAGARALVPLRFGQTLPDEAALAETVTRLAPRLRAALARVAGCDQVTLRVFGVREDDAQADGDGARPGDAELGPGARYLALRREQRARETAVPTVLEPALAAVAPHVRAQRVERHDTGPLVASVYQLVPRAARDAHRHALDEALAELCDVHVHVSGPWPAYAFADGLGLGGALAEGRT
jgi:hypothetical protein